MIIDIAQKYLKMSKKKYHYFPIVKPLIHLCNYELKSVKLNIHCE